MNNTNATSSEKRKIEQPDLQQGENEKPTRRQWLKNENVTKKKRIYIHNEV